MDEERYHAEEEWKLFRVFRSDISEEIWYEIS